MSADRQICRCRAIGGIAVDTPFKPVEWVPRLMLMTVSFETTALELMIRSTTLRTAASSDTVH
jgi:hypothetical protein